MGLAEAPLNHGQFEPYLNTTLGYAKVKNFRRIGSLLRNDAIAKAVVRKIYSLEGRFVAIACYGSRSRQWNLGDRFSVDHESEKALQP